MNRRDFLNAALVALAPAGLMRDRPRVPLSKGGRAQAGQDRLRVDGDRLNRHLTELSAFGRNADGGIDRIAYSNADVAARRFVMDLMREAKLEVRVDAAGNILGERAGRDRSLPRILFGSHIDSVPGGGNYDGQVGSIAAIEVAHSLADLGVTTRHTIEVVIFQNEENGKVGSRAMRGEDPTAYLDQMTHSGKTIREGIRFIGGDPDRVAGARRRPGEIAAFFELHIEQGDVLDRSGVPIGIVEGIVGIKRWMVTITGFANHAGTTPMDRRQDALLAAARFIDAANRVTTSMQGRQVATVGSIEAEPGAPNVIAGRARLTLEMRDLELEKVDRLFEQIRQESEQIAQATGTTFAFEEIYRTLPARTDDRMRALIESTARDLGFRTLSLPSGAGHDAQEIARLAPMGMIFIPSAGGISHSPREYSRPEQIVNGANVLLNVVARFDRQ